MPIPRVHMIIEIAIVDREKYREEVKKATEQTLAGKTRKKKVVMTPKLFAKVFSAKRLEMLIHMAKEGHGSVSDLARTLGRRYEVIYRDLRFFEQLGFVKLTEGERNSLIPELIGEIRMAMPISGL